MTMILKDDTASIIDKSYVIKEKQTVKKPTVTLSHCSKCSKTSFSATAELARIYMLLSENVASEEILAVLKNAYDWSEIDKIIEHKKKSIASTKQETEEIDG